MWVCILIILLCKQAADVIVLYRVSFPWQGSLGMRLGPYHWSTIPFPRAKLLLVTGGILPHQTTRGGGREGGEGEVGGRGEKVRWEEGGRR